MDVCTVCVGSGTLLDQVCPLCDGLVPEGVPGGEALLNDGSSIEELCSAMLEDLKQFSPVSVSDMDPSLHYLAPHIPKVRWTALGDLVTGREKSGSGNIDGSRWISLRLDGSGFSKVVKIMRHKGILEPEGFSDRFAKCMQACLRSLMDKFNARIGYTQSDEMVVFLSPTSIIRGERQVHMYNGRVTKLITLAASYVTARFVLQLAQMCLSNNVGLDGLAGVAPHFDCRLGVYDSWEEARALLFWRAHDCSVNGVSDAVYHIKGSGKEVQSYGKREKVEWLWKQGRLPLPCHQAYGTLLVKVKRMKPGYNPKTCEIVSTLRGEIEQVSGPVLELARTEALFPCDDDKSIG